MKQLDSNEMKAVFGGVDIEIIDAAYGIFVDGGSISSNKSIKVTKAIKNLCYKADSCVVIANNYVSGTFNDPAPGEFKSIRISFKCDNTKHTATGSEGASILLSCYTEK